MMQRVYWILILVTLLLLVIAPAVLAGGGPDKFALRLTLDKTLVEPGEAIQVSGIGAEAGQAVGVLIVPFPASGANALATVEVTPNANGAFSATVTAPATTATGRYAIRAEQPPGYGALVNQYAWVGLCVTECTGETLGSMLPDTGGAAAREATPLWVFSGLLLLALAVNGVVWRVRPR